MPRPFIYIASLPRTGSTLLAEALTQVPHSFIFREPQLGRGRFNLKRLDAEFFATRGIHIATFKRRFYLRHAHYLALELTGAWPRWSVSSGAMVDAFKRDLYPRLIRCATQIGVKEIRHEGWRNYLCSFGDTRIIITGRDPRDIYISFHHQVRRGKAQWAGDYTPETVAAHLLEQFQHQLAMTRASACLRVRYEDLCKNPGFFNRIKAFVDSPIADIGEVGAFNDSNPNRRDEAELHGGQITARQVGRWRDEVDPVLRSEAARIIDLMVEYCAFWHYDEAGPRPMGQPAVGDRAA